MPVSSYVIRCAPADQAAVRREIEAIAGTQVGTPTPLGFPVAAETATTGAAEELGERLQRVPGVKSAVLVYHNFEDVAETTPAASKSDRL